MKNFFSELVGELLVVFEEPPVLAVSYLVVDEPPLLVEPFLSVFFTANTGVTRRPLLDAVTRDIAVAIARIANAVVVNCFLYIELTI